MNWRLIGSCITQLKAQAPSGTCDERKEDDADNTGAPPYPPPGARASDRAGCRGAGAGRCGHGVEAKHIELTKQITTHCLTQRDVPISLCF